MTLTLQIPPELEERLRQHAAAAGRDTSDLAADLLSHAVGQLLPPESAISEPEQERLRVAINEWLKYVETIRPDPNPPHLKGQEAEIERIIIDNLNKERRRS